MDGLHILLYTVRANLTVSNKMIANKQEKY